MKKWIAAIARHPAVLVVPIGVMLFVPFLDVGPIFDDFYHLAILEKLDPESEIGPLSLWAWHKAGRRAVFGSPVQGDPLPWWAARDLNIDFFRPLPSLVHQLDHAVYGRNVVGWHVTSLLLWALVLATILRLYRELGRLAGLGPGTLAMAGLFFALDECHTWNVVWPATRHSLLGVLFAAGTVAAYLHFRRTGQPRKRWLAVGLLVLGLLSAEVAVGAVLWIAAFELTMARDRPLVRLRSAAPFLLLLALYVVFYKLAGFGSHGNNWYVDPFDAPRSFFTQVLPHHLPRLLQGLLTPIPAEVGVIFDAPGYALAGQIFLLIMIVAFLPLLWRDRAFRFVALATLLSALPTSLPTPVNYLLLWPSVGVAWLLAAFLARLAEAWRRARHDGEGKDTGRLRRRARFVPALAVGLVVILVHGVYAPVMAYGSGLILERTHQWPTAVAQEADYPAPEEAEDARVLVVTLPSSLLATYFGYDWRVRRPRPWPPAIWSISSAVGEHRFIRTSDRGFRLEIPEPGILSSIWDGVIQDGADVATGARYRRGALEVTVTRMADDGTIREIEVSIDRSLDDPEVWLLAWDGDRLARFRPPAAGGAVVLSPAPAASDG